MTTKLPAILLILGAAALLPSAVNGEIIVNSAKVTASANGVYGGPSDIWNDSLPVAPLSASGGGVATDATFEFSSDTAFAILGGSGDLSVAGGAGTNGNSTILWELDVTVTDEPTVLTLVSEADGTQSGNNYYAQLFYDVIEYDIAGPLIGWVVNGTYDSSSDPAFALSQADEVTLQPGSRYLVRIQQTLYGQNGIATSVAGIAFGNPDADGDGVADGDDAFPNDPTEWEDTDGDGVGDNADEFPESITDPEFEACGIVIGNVQLENGATLADEIMFALYNDISTPDLVHELQEYRNAGYITGREMGQIIRANNLGCIN